jgi:hypothetical protein
MELVALLCVLPFVLAGLAMILYRKTVRGRAEQVILMDGAICKKLNTQEVVIKPRTVYNLVAMGVIGLFPLGFAALIVIGVTGGGPSGRLSLGAILKALAWLPVLGGIVYWAWWSVSNVRSIPSLRFDGELALLEARRGKMRRDVSFSSISQIWLAEGSTWHKNAIRVAVAIVLDDGSSIPLGTLSGNTKPAKRRAAALAQLIAGLTGAKVFERRVR